MPPRTAVRSATRQDTLTLAVCMALSLIALVAPPAVREPVAGGLRRGWQQRIVGDEALPPYDSEAGLQLQKVASSAICTFYWNLLNSPGD